MLAKMEEQFGNLKLPSSGARAQARSPFWSLLGENYTAHSNFLFPLFLLPGSYSALLVPWYVTIVLTQYTSHSNIRFMILTKYWKNVILLIYIIDSHNSCRQAFVAQCPPLYIMQFILREENRGTSEPILRNPGFLHMRRSRKNFWGIFHTKIIYTPKTVNVSISPCLLKLKNLSIRRVFSYNFETDTSASCEDILNTIPGGLQISSSNFVFMERKQSEDCQNKLTDGVMGWRMARSGADDGVSVQ